MSQILIAGATGLIGQALVRELSPAHSLTLLCRKPGEPAPGRHWLPVDFEHLDEVALPTPIDLAFCCLGTTRKEAGSGLGLAIVRELAEASHGSVAAAASPMGGARLEVVLPLRAG